MTGWADAHDGVLAMDRNGNGIIDDGKELFGDQTMLRSGRRATNGFEALADLDSNRDGKIDASDEAYSQLRVLTLNAAGDAYQLRTLEELGIKAINLDSTITNTTDKETRRTGWAVLRCLTGPFDKSLNTAFSAIQLPLPSQPNGSPSLLT